MLDWPSETKRGWAAVTQAMKDWLGASPQDVARGLLDFSRSSELLSKDRTLVDKYAQKWVGVCSGEVKAADEDLDSLLRELDRAGVRRSDTVVRFIEREQRTLIL